MELHDLHYFVAVAENLHFGRAAEQLHLTQPALSRQIRALENELEVQLFYRTKRKVELTIAGQTFLEEARQILRHAERAVLTTRKVARGEMGELKLSFTASALRSVVPQILRVFRDRYPEVRLTLTEQCTCDQVEALLARQIDVGFLHPPVDETLLVTIPLRTDVCAIALPEDHPLVRKKLLNLSDLAHEPFLLHPRQEGPNFYDRILRLCQEAGFRPNVVQEVTANQTRIGLVAAGMGITFIPETLQDIGDPTVIYRYLQGPAPTLPLAIARRCDDTSPVVQHFCKVVDDQLKTNRNYAPLLKRPDPTLANCPIEHYSGNRKK